MPVKKQKNEKKNYVGHLTFPYNEEVSKLVFKPTTPRRIKQLKFGTKCFTCIDFDKTTLDFFKSVGYSVQIKEVETNWHKSIKKFHDIPISAMVEYEYANRRGTPKEIILSYSAPTLSDITERGKLILNSIYEFTGILGEGDVYGKMEMC